MTAHRLRFVAVNFARCGLAGAAEKPRGSQMTGSIDLQTDIALAMRFHVPVLITAPPGPALAVARLIAGARSGPRKPADVILFDGAAIVSAALGDRESAAAASDAVLLVEDVEALGDVEQAALLLLIDDEKTHARRRIISTSSVCVFDRVGQGTFDATLFYRLNAIHIIGESCSDRAAATWPCCPREADERSRKPSQAESAGNPARPPDL